MRQDSSPATSMPSLDPLWGNWGAGIEAKGCQKLIFVGSLLGPGHAGPPPTPLQQDVGWLSNWKFTTK